MLRNPWLAQVLVTVGLFGLYTFDSVNRYEHFGNGAFDLGVMVQSVKGWASFTGPISSIKGPGFNLLGDHFSPIIAVMAPLWWVWPSPVTMLVVQALLLALGAVPLMVWAKKEFGQAVSLLIGLVYGFSFGILNAVNFDFHEVVFAVPVISLSVTLLGMRRHRAALVAAAPLVLIKEDLGISYIAAMGVVLLLRREWLLGAIAIIGGLGCSAIEMTLIIPTFNPGGVYDYASRFSLDPVMALQKLSTGSDVKAFTAIATLGISSFLAARSPLFILVLANLLPRLLTSNYNYYGPIMHYSAIPMVLVLAAMIDGLVRIRLRSIRRNAVLTVVMAGSIIMTVLLWILLQVPDLLGRQLATSDQAASLNVAIGKVPSGDTVLASDQTVPHLAVGHDVNVLTESAVKRYSPEWIVADPISHAPESPAQRSAMLHRIEREGYSVVYENDGAVVLRRDR